MVFEDCMLTAEEWAALDAKEASPTIQPLNDWILVRRDDALDVSTGGIVIPERAKAKPKEGIVMAVGPGKLLIGGARSPVSVRVGERVLFPSYAGTEIEADGEQLILMAEEMVLAVKGRT